MCDSDRITTSSFKQIAQEWDKLHLPQGWRPQACCSWPMWFELGCVVSLQSMVVCKGLESEGNVWHHPSSLGMLRSGEVSPAMV